MATKLKNNDFKVKVIDEYISSDISLAELGDKYGLTKSQVNYLFYMDKFGRDYYLNRKTNSNTRRHRGKYTVEFKNKVLDALFEVGHISEAADKFGVVPGTVRKWLMEFYPDKYDFYVTGHELNPGYSDQDKLEKIIEDRASGMPWKDIAEKYGMKPNTLVNAVSKYKKEGIIYSAGYDHGLGAASSKVSDLFKNRAFLKRFSDFMAKELN